jgi:cytoskeletal protein RodZ
MTVNDQVSVGAQLRAARDAARYSIENIADRTYIRPSVITDLENDKFDSAGGLAYARGHVRTIAKILNLDVDAITADFEALTNVQERPMIDLLTENKAAHEKGELSKISYKTMSAVAVGVVALLVLVPTVSSLFHSSAKKVVVASKPSTTTPATGSNGVATVATKLTDVTIVVTGVTGSSWVGVSDSAGAQVYSGRISVGASQTFTNSQPLNIVIGNAGAVNLVVNGKDLGTPGAVGEVVHLQFAPGTSSQG